jgi:hypothetical protein
VSINSRVIPTIPEWRADLVTHVGQKFAAQSRRLERRIARLRERFAGLPPIVRIADRPDEQVRRERVFDQIVLGPEFDRVMRIGVVVVGIIQSHDRYVGRGLIKPTERQEALRLGQRQIEQNHIDVRMTESR